MTNKIHEAFDQVKASEELKASTMRFLEERRAAEARGEEVIREGEGAVREKTPVRKPRRYFRAVAVACAMLCLVIGIGGYQVANTAVAYVSIDVNPSIELELNRFDNVVSASAYNDDGKRILKTIDVKGLSYQDAIECIVDSDAMKPYLAKKDSQLTFTVAAKNRDKEAGLLKGVKSCENRRAKSYCASMKSVEKAHGCGMSVGKYRAFEELSKYDSSVTTEDCENMTMGEIHDRIREHQSDGEHGSQTNSQGAQHGSGHSASGSQHRSGGSNGGHGLGHGHE